MSKFDYYGEFYRPGPQAVAGTYSADNFLPNFKKLMEMKGLTQADVAHKCGLTPPMVYNWLAGNSEPSLYSLARICEGLEIEPNWLLSKHEYLK